MSRRRIAALLAGIAVVVLGAGGLLACGALQTGGAPQASVAPLATASVERQTLDATTQVDGTLGYADSYAPGGQAAYTIENGLATTGGADAASLLSAYAQAQAQYDSAANALAALEHPKATDTAQAEAQLAQVEATLTSARQSAAGPTPKDVAQARSQLDQAQAQLVQAQQAVQGPTTAQLSAAQAQLAQAQAGLVSAQNAAAGPSAAQQAQAQAQLTQAQNALTSDQAALAAAQAAYQACASASGATPAPSGAPTPAPCDLSALALQVQQDQSKVSDDQATLTSSQAALAALTSPQSQQEAQATLASAQDQVNAAQAALDALSSAASSAQAQANLASAQAGAQAAEAALAALTSSATRAQAEAGLSAAQAQVNAAQTALSALLHPSAQQLQQAQDQVSAARPGLAAAKAKLSGPSGVVTQLAPVGARVAPGQQLYTLDGTHPAVLFQGDVPAWRQLAPGMSNGPDVKELEQNLQALGYAASAFEVDEHWDSQTTAAVKRWQRSLGLPQTGVVPYGAIVFEPGPLLITADTASLGATIGAGAPVLQATTTSRIVTVALDPALQSDVKQGDAVSVVLPDGSTTPGTVSNVGTVATQASSDQGSGSTPPPTIDVQVTLDAPAVAGTLDEAPVSVNITTASASNVLAVPVQALVELLEGGYAVQIDDGGHLHYLRVTLGIFANGWVQVSGAGLAAGQTVVVAQ
ncbi:MAG: peptidoglycan-binding protein [Candidatus Limnocylindrales bacterium]